MLNQRRECRGTLGLTEQIFRPTFVVTVANICSPTARHLGDALMLARVKREHPWHLDSVLRGATCVLASSRERTIVDGALEPRWVDGLHHLADVFSAYVCEPNANPATPLAAGLLRRSVC